MADHQAAALAAHPELQRLIDLSLAGWTWMPPEVDDGGHVVEVHGMRTWPGGFADAVRIRYTTDAMAVRVDFEGGIVWRREGGLADVVDDLIALPSPGTRGAPRLVIGHVPTEPRRS